MKTQTVCFTGHRNIPREEYNRLSLRLRSEIACLIGRGYRFFGAGGALGFDTLAAKTVLELRKQYPHIRLILVLPCLHQSDKWCSKDRLIYEQIKSNADKTVYTADDYTQDCMHKRNRHLVDNSNLCICYLTKASGGTAYTVRYAQQQGLTIINLAKQQ